MSKKQLNQLSRRERQIVDILYRQGEAAVADVLKALPDPPSYSTVRALLAVLVEKGYVKHRQNGRQYLYSPTVSRTQARRTALNHVVQTFFDDSVEDVVAALMSMKSTKSSTTEYERLSRLIEARRKKGKK
ncbi:MAG: BlaI/MecI/CopY family transcriptional regulator [candidate division Zixibacteria bacterium]|nr:BlaI/MecI/CopY family transcriptional regulator [candidate division Zixibacteria bacterium]MDH3937558.1 BlaI/MecI/CopY family transcriptional regulator [candidate division Zixibacteria bacterium]MDH4034986.1 BlaI/MecI/CopY family transcriptional regulator [candidate division Zixibacteria bacterium]